MVTNHNILAHLFFNFFNYVSSFQLNEPSLVEGLVLINVDPCAKGWMDWAASKVMHINMSSVNENFLFCPLVVLRHFQPHVSEVLRFLCL